MKQGIRLQDAVALVCHNKGLSEEELLRGRSYRCVRARHLLWHLLRAAGWSGAEIAKGAGNWAPGTVQTAFRGPLHEQHRAEANAYLNLLLR